MGSQSPFPLNPDAVPDSEARCRAYPSRWFWLLVLFSIITIAAGAWQLIEQRRSIAAAAQPAAEGLGQASDFRLMGIDGQYVQLSDLQGKVVLLNFWATWCPPCKAEMPDLDELHRRYGPEHDLVVLGINMEETQPTVTAFAQEHNLSFPLLLDSEGKVSAQVYRIRSLPTSMIIDRNGKIRDMWIGQIPRSAMLARLERIW